MSAGISSTSWVTAFYPGSTAPQKVSVKFAPHAILRAGTTQWVVAAVVGDDTRVTGFGTEDEAVDLARKLADECKAVKA